MSKSAPAGAPNAGASAGAGVRHAKTQNAEIAAKLEDMASVLAEQNDNPFRINAYRGAASAIVRLDRSVRDILSADGVSGLDAIPGIGPGIARAIAEMLQTGRWAQLERLTGALAPEQLFQTLPGIGPKLAEQIHDTLHVDTLEQLEGAAEDGSLAAVKGVGARRAAGVLAVLRERLGRRRVRRAAQADRPSIEAILDVDREYRDRAGRDDLAKIAPRRFNPSGAAWLPVLHTTRGDWRFTALFSNTRRAHELARTHDWVVIYAHRDEEPDLQCTVVTETRGPLVDQRVVRGREGDCIAHYSGAAAGEQPLGEGAGGDPATP